MTVNKKKFRFLLNHFLAEYRLQEKWFNASKSFKKQDHVRKTTYDLYGIKTDDNYEEHLSKCIDIYVGETVTTNRLTYGKTIRGFFRFIPSGGCDGDNAWLKFWKKYSDIWENRTYGIGYSENGEEY